MMANRKQKGKDRFGKDVEGTVVGVLESIERFSEVTLEDGTILKTKLTTIEAIRMDGHWDIDGNPLYNIKSTNIVAISESPEELKKKVQ